MSIETQIARLVRSFSYATYTESESTCPYSDSATGPDLNKVVTVYRAGQIVFVADPARVVSSDAAGDCSNQLRVECLASDCGVQCNGSACGVKAVAATAE